MDTSADLRGDWTYPTAVRFGAGRIAELPAAVAALGLRNPLFVTDDTLAGLPIVAEALAALAAAGIATAPFCDIRANPTTDNVAAGIAAYREGAHDGVIAFGGGSALDAGKMIAFMQGQQRPLADFEDVGDNWRRADAAAIAPVLAVPTTAGTGSEVGRAAVVTDTDAGIKRIIFHPGMMPKIAICDPALTVGMPAAVTAGTGMDAFAHCLEAFCSKSFHPLADGIALEGMRLAKDNLVAAFKRPKALVPRANMMAAALMGATAFQKALGVVHALSHPIGALHDTPHGMTNAVLLPYAMVFNRAAIEDKILRLARTLELPASFDAVLDWVLMLREQLDVPPTLAELGVTDAHAERIAEMALADPTAGGNPIPLELTATRRLFLAALNGRL